MYSLFAFVDFGGVEEEVALECPGAGFVLSFSKKDFLHIKKE